MAIKLKHFKTRAIRYPALAAATVTALVATGFVFDLNKSEWAYWVQAFGSIGAIVGTWYATKFQLSQAARGRAADKLEADVANAQIAFDLATDTSRALRNVQKKFDVGHRQFRKVTIGTERFDTLGSMLQNFTAKPIAPALYAEMLSLQREVSYTLTAINQQNDMRGVEIDRVQSATKRCAAVLTSLERVRMILVKAIHATGKNEVDIGPTNPIEDSEW